MNVILYKKNDSVFYSKGDNLKVLTDFIDSDCDIVELTNYSHKSPNNCISTFSQAIKKYRIHGIKVVMRKGRIFLMKVPIE